MAKNEWLNVCNLHTRHFVTSVSGAF